MEEEFIHVLGAGFPVDEYLMDTLGANSSSTMSYHDIRCIPYELKVKACEFWLNIKWVRPSEPREFQYPGGLRDPRNFPQEFVDFFVDSRGIGWVKVKNKINRTVTWINSVDAQQMDEEQLVYKILLNQLIYKNKVWWEIEVLVSVLKFQEEVLIDLSGDSVVDIESSVSDSLVEVVEVPN